MKEEEFDCIVDGIQSQIDAEEEKVFPAKVLKEFRDPKNLGRIEDPDRSGMIRGPCGDTMEFSINIREGRVRKILFVTDGCGPSIACGSMTTKMAKGKTVEEALKIKGRDILNALDGLPEENRHCAKLAVDALHETLGKFPEENP